MIADGVVKGVQGKIDSPIDRLLYAYVAAKINSDILGMYLASAPPGEGTIKLISEMVRVRYPFVENKSTQRADEIAKYNNSVTLSNKLMKGKRS